MDGLDATSVVVYFCRLPRAVFFGEVTALSLRCLFLSSALGQLEAVR